MRILKTIKWLLNRPPTSIINKESDTVCDYCGASNFLWEDNFCCICQKCRKKVFDKVLGKPKKKK